MNAERVETKLIESGAFASDVEISVSDESESRGMEPGVFSVLVQFPPRLRGEDLSRLQDEVVSAVDDVLEFSVHEVMFVGEGQEARREFRGDTLHMEGPTGPVVKLEVLGVLLDEV